MGTDGHCELSGQTETDDGFSPASPPWATSGLEGSTGERGREIPEASGHSL